MMVVTHRKKIHREKEWHLTSMTWNRWWTNIITKNNFIFSFSHFLTSSLSFHNSLKNFLMTNNILSFYHSIVGIYLSEYNGAFRHQARARNDDRVTEHGMVRKLDMKRVFARLVCCSRQWLHILLLSVFLSINGTVTHFLSITVGSRGKERVCPLSICCLPAKQNILYFVHFVNKRINQSVLSQSVSFYMTVTLIVCTVCAVIFLFSYSLISSSIDPAPPLSIFLLSSYHFLSSSFPDISLPIFLSYIYSILLNGHHSQALLEERSSAHTEASSRVPFFQTVRRNDEVM